MNDAPRPVRLRLSRKAGFNLQRHSIAVNGLPAVNCARPGKFGNPFIFGDDEGRLRAIELFERCVTERPTLFRHKCLRITKSMNGRGEASFFCHEEMDERGAPTKACAGFARLRAKRKASAA